MPLSEITYRSLLNRAHGFDRGPDNVRPRAECVHATAGGWLPRVLWSEPALQEGECVIVNTHDAPGEHWTAIATIDGETIPFRRRRHRPGS